MFLKKNKPLTSTLRHKKQLNTYFINNRFFYNTKIYIKNFSGRNTAGKITTRHKSYNIKHRLIVMYLSKKYPGLSCLIENFVFSQKNKKILAVTKFSNGCICFIPLMYGSMLGEQFLITCWFKRFYHLSYLNSNILLTLIKPYMIISHVCTFYFNNKLATSFGTCVKVLFVPEDKLIFKIKLPSKQEKYISRAGFAYIGRNTFISHKAAVIGKAGFNRNHGLRPAVRGVAMNPVDHPNGGRTKVNKPEKSPWGWVAKKNK